MFLYPVRNLILAGMKENLKIALRSLDSNRLRSVLTISIIAVGIMSLVGIQTAIEILTEKVTGSFEKMGAGMFTVQSKKDAAGLTLRQAEQLREAASDYTDAASIYEFRGVIARASSDGATTDPVCCLVACDTYYILCQSGIIAEGRNLLESDCARGLKVAVVGDNVRKRLFGADSSGIGHRLSVEGGSYTIVGALQRQGSVFGTSLDDSILVPMTEGSDVSLDMIPKGDMVRAVDRTAALMRSIRRLGSTQKPDFEIVKSASAEDGLSKVSGKLSLAALGIGLITLLGAAVGLMNIMLVSVKQRTREIGVRKALGARPSVISRQFLAESVVIGQIGGAAGIVLGILFGNIVALIMEGDFLVPWRWVAIAVAICFVVSILSGLLPARRAAALDPIIALYSE